MKRLRDYQRRDNIRLAAENNDLPPRDVYSYTREFRSSKLRLMPRLYDEITYDRATKVARVVESTDLARDALCFLPLFFVFPSQTREWTQKKELWLQGATSCDPKHSRRKLSPKERSSCNEADYSSETFWKDPLETTYKSKVFYSAGIPIIYIYIFFLGTMVAFVSRSSSSCKIRLRDRPNMLYVS